MSIKRDELLTSKLRICENCEWCCYHEDSEEHPKCLLDGQQRGLVENCSKFKQTTGHHFTIYH